MWPTCSVAEQPRFGAAPPRAGYGPDVDARATPDTARRVWTWKAVSALTAMAAAFGAKRLLRAVYGSVRKDDAPATPFDPTSERFSVVDAVLWAAAAGIGLAIAKVLGDRLASLGWEVATGTRPPGSGDTADA